MLIIKYWDCFCAKGARRTILDYEFVIDTGSSPPICCCRPKYSPHEKPIIMDQIASLIANNWIENPEVHRAVCLSWLQHLIRNISTI